VYARAVPGAPSSSRARRKDAARELLARFDLAGVERWAAGEPQAARVLQALLFEADELLAWRAVEGLGRAAAVLARGGEEPARELARRTLWLMNDESGGLLWRGAEVLGAVLANVPALCRDLGAVLASFLEEEPFRAGARWGLWRISAVAPAAVREVAPALAASFADADPAVRGLAALALRGAGAPVPDLSADRAAFTLFDFRTGELREATVAEAAQPPA
jgi:hypothetical protein